MADARTRTRNLLNALPLSSRQRELYERGVSAMDDAALERVANRLESALSTAPQALAAAQELLATEQARQRKRVCVLVEDEDFRRVLANTLGDTAEIATVNMPEQAIDMLRHASFDILVCDFKMAHISGADLVRRLRRISSISFAAFVRTNNPEEDGEVAAVGATGYPVSHTATDLTRAVTSAIEATSR